MYVLHCKLNPTFLDWVIGRKSHVVTWLLMVHTVLYQWPFCECYPRGSRFANLPLVMDMPAATGMSAERGVRGSFGQKVGVLGVTR